MHQEEAFTFRDLFRRDRLPSLITAFALLGVAYTFEHYANVYAFIYTERSTTTHVGDFILDGIPAIDLNFIIIEVALFAIVIGTAYVISKPRYLVFTLKAIALFIIIRAIFISLTHVGIHPENIAPGRGFFDAIYLYLHFQTGLFFSGHTGLPFLIALIFWKKPVVRNILLLLSLVFAAAVLLAHVHYSIDVFAAPFMAYGIYRIARYFFPKDHELIEKDTVFKE